MGTAAFSAPHDVCFFRVPGAEQFERRMEALSRALLARPERVLAVVAHWGVCCALTGRDFANCELFSCRGEDLLL